MLKNYLRIKSMYLNVYLMLPIHAVFLPLLLMKFLLEHWKKINWSLKYSICETNAKEILKAWRDLYTKAKRATS